MHSLFSPIGVVIRSAIVAVAIGLFGQGLWSALIVTNLRITPAIPWAVPLMALALWVMWEYLGGRWWPRSSAQARRHHLRANRVSGDAFAWALTAGALSIAALAGYWIVMSQIVRMPANVLPDMSAYPWTTTALMVAMGSLVSPVLEQAGFWGYGQVMLEQEFSAANAIIIAAVLFALLPHPPAGAVLWPKLVFYFLTGVTFGVTAYLTNSIVPGLIVHIVGDVIFFALVWPHDTARRLIAQGGADGWFWIHVAQAIVLTALAAFAFRRLARVAQGARATDEGNAALPQVVIVGAGFGGLNAAWALRRARARVTLIDRRNHHLFQPLLYQVATAGLSPANIAYPIRSIVRRNLNTHVLLDEVLAIDLGTRRVTTTRGDVRYDFLIVAAGADNSYFGHDEWAQFAPGLKSLEDALDIRRRILLAFELAEQERDETARRILLTFLVIGGGPTGVELAGAIAEISRQVIVSDFRRIDPREARIILVEAGPRILPTFDESLATKAGLALSKRGVEVLVGSPVKAVTLDAIHFEKSEIKARTIIWAAGVAASKLAKSMGTPLDRAGRVKVRPDLTVEGHPEVFVIGDLAACADASGKMIPGLAPVAIQEGRCAAANIMRALAGQQHRPFKYVDKGALATVGRAFAIAQIGAFKVSGLIAWLIWSLVHIAYLVGFRNRVVVMFEWAWAYVTYQRGARLITGDVEKWMAVKQEPSRPDDEIRRSGSRL